MGVSGEQEKSFQTTMKSAGHSSPSLIANLVYCVSRSSEFSLWGTLLLFSYSSVSESTSFALRQRHQ